MQVMLANEALWARRQSCRVDNRYVEESGEVQMSTYKTIELDVSRAGVAVIRLNRPETGNALNAEVIGEFADVVEVLAKTPEVRVVLLRGRGDVFSAGADIEWMRAAADYTTHENEEDAYAVTELLRHLREMPQLTIALVQGAARGGGIGLMAACDVAVAMQSTEFGLGEVRLGVIPATISPYVVEAVGPRWARALAATGESFDAAFAHQIGLVQYVVADENEMDSMVEHLTALAFKASPAAIAATKDLIDAVVGEPIDSGLGRMTAKRLAQVRSSAHGREGLSAFLENRKPSWDK